MSIADYAEDKLVDAVLRHTTTGGGLPTANPYLQLHSGDPGEAGTTNVVSVARVQAAFDASSGGHAQNTAVIDVASMPAVTVMAWSLHDAAGSGLPPTGGNCLWTGWLSTLGGVAIVKDAATTDDIYIPDHGLSVDDRIVFEVVEGLSVPAGITAGTVYFVKTSATDVITVSTTSGGATLSITGDGQTAWRKVVPKTTNLNDTFEIAAGDLDIYLD